MGSFSERMGIKPVREILQTDSMDDELRNRLWNALDINYWNYFGIPPYDEDNVDIFFILIWDRYFKRPIDTLPKYNSGRVAALRSYFLSCEWNHVYDFIQFIITDTDFGELNTNFISHCNNILTKESSAYRFVGKKIVQITSDEEIFEIDEALQIPMKPVREHLKQALELLADRENPDYRNSIKESISAVESMCKIITDDGNIRTALIKIRKDLSLHDNLKTAFQNLYSYTSDASGIRHCMTADPDVGQEEAKFMLVTCSAFVNYLVVKASKAGIDLSTPSSK